jgi:hypothetical protein
MTEDGGFGALIGWEMQEGEALNKGLRILMGCGRSELLS